MRNKQLPYSNKGDLTTGPLGRHLVRLTVPMIWSMLAVISLQLVDTFFISMLGTRELAGISFTFPVTMIITHMVFGLNIAMASVISRLIGQKKIGDVRRVVLHGMLMAAGTSIAVCAACYIFLDPLFKMLGAGPHTLPVIREYMPLWLIGAVFLSAPVNGNSAIRAAGDSFVPAMIMVSMALLNLALDPVMIFGLFGFPALGVTGAALATMIAYIFCFVLGLYVLAVRKKLVALDGLHLDQFLDSVKRLVFIAIPAGIANIIQPSTNAFIIALLAAYGPESVAAFGVVTRVEAFALLIVMSLSLGMVPIIGQNWGAENYSRVHRTINLALGFNVAWSAVVALGMGLFAHTIAGVFSADPKVIDTAALFFWIVPFSYAFSNMVYGWGSAFNAMGMPQRAFMMILVKSIAMTIPAVFVGRMLYGIEGIFIAMAAVNTVAGIYFHVSSWNLCKAHEHRQPAAA